MAVLGLAIYLRLDSRTNNFVRAAYTEDDVLLYHILCYILIGTGTVVTFVGFLGCCGAFQESRCMLGCVRRHFIDFFFGCWDKSMGIDFVGDLMSVVELLTGMRDGGLRAIIG